MSDILDYLEARSWKLAAVMLLMFFIISGDGAYLATSLLMSFLDNRLPK